MSFAYLPNHMRPQRREKVFGDGRPVPLDRNAKVRIMTLARALSRRTEAGKHWGLLTGKFLDVLNALLWGFHNAATGRCFPSYEAIADKASCARSTVYEALRALEEAGILTWVHRIVRVREFVEDLFGRRVAGWRVERTSNAYSFVDPKLGAGIAGVAETPVKPSKSELQTRTPLQGSSLTESALEAALGRLGKAMKHPGPEAAQPANANVGACSPP